MKRIGVYLMLFSSLLLAGCEIDKDKLYFSTVFLVDCDENNKTIVYMETIHGYRNNENNAEEGIRLVLSGSGDTIVDAVKDLKEVLDFDINLTQNKMMIFTERAAKYGLDNYLDYFLRDQDFLLRSYLVIYEGEPATLFDTKIKQVNNVGLYLYEMLRNKSTGTTKGSIQFHEYLNNRAIGNKVEVVEEISITDGVNSELKVNKGAVLVDDKMKDQLTKDELVTYNNLMGNISSGSVTILHPLLPGKYISLDITKNKLESKVNYDGNIENTINFKKIFDMGLSFSETQKSIDLTDKELQTKIEDAVKLKVEKESQELFEKYKIKGIDLLNLQEEFYRDYPEYKSYDVIKMAKLDIEVEASIGGSYNTINFNLTK